MSKQILLQDLKDSLIELNKKRKDNNTIQSNAKYSWRKALQGLTKHKGDSRKDLILS